MHEWESWLQKWNRELLARYDAAESSAFVDPRVTPAVLASGWLGFPGLSDAQLDELEARLGMTLPPSYCSFLRVSNGFLQPGVVVPRILPAGEVAWLRDVDPDTIDAWTGAAARTGGEIDPDSFESSLPAALQVSARETVGTAMYLLNPQIVSADGEWEAFFFAHWVPGVRRFPSFWALMQAEFESLLAPAPPPPPSRLKTFVGASFSKRHVNILTNINTFTGNNTLRPDLVGDIKILKNVNQWFGAGVCDPRVVAPAAGACDSNSVFALPYSPGGVLHFGSLPRNALVGPAFSNVDLSLIKNVTLKGPARAQFRVEVFNLFNTANFGQPGRIAIVGSTAFGVITNTRFPTGDSGSSRQVQFAAKFLF